MVEALTLRVGVGVRVWEGVNDGGVADGVRVGDGGEPVGLVVTFQEAENVGPPVKVGVGDAVWVEAVRVVVKFALGDGGDGVVVAVPGVAVGVLDVGLALQVGVCVAESVAVRVHESVALRVRGGVRWALAVRVGVALGVKLGVKVRVSLRVAVRLEMREAVRLGVREVVGVKEVEGVESVGLRREQLALMVCVGGEGVREVRVAEKVGVGVGVRLAVPVREGVGVREGVTVRDP